MPDPKIPSEQYKQMIANKMQEAQSTIGANTMQSFGVLVAPLIDIIYRLVDEKAALLAGQEELKKTASLEGLEAVKKPRNRAARRKAERQQKKSK